MKSTILSLNQFNTLLTKFISFVLPISVMLFLFGAISSPAFAAHVLKQQAPIWAVQLLWTPSSPTLQLEYDSSNPQAPMNGAYQAATALMPAERPVWQIHTWKISNVNFRGRQNYGADLRLSGTPGIAIHQITLSTQPPSQASSSENGSEAMVILNSSLSGANIEKGMHQVGAGGDIGDSLYKTGVVGGRSAEILTQSGKFKYLYLYFRLERQSSLYLSHPSTVYVTVTYAETRPVVAWSTKTFKQLTKHGIRFAELLLSWGTLEPKPGLYDFRLLDETLRNAARAHILILPIFLNGKWPGCPAPWITHYDVDSSGNASEVPTWWNRFNRQSYFHYVTSVIKHIKHNPAFGGAFLDFGWLDYMWGPKPAGRGVNGYAPEDIAKFHSWLPMHFHSLSAFDRLYGVNYSSWSSVPAATEGQPLFPVYQEFRSWSVEETYGRMSALVRKETNAPLYYYWGGGYNGIGVAFNLPDIFFRVAHRYDATVVFDCAEETGLALLFNTLARVYNVKLMLEWTPLPTGLEAEMAEFLGHYGFGMPNMVGMDFFLYKGGKEFDVGYPMYVKWLPFLSRIKGSYPLQPVAVYFSYHPVLEKPDALAAFSAKLASMWRTTPLGFTVITNQEVDAGLVNLHKYRAILPLNGQDDPAILSYRAHGGHVVDRPEQLAQYASPYITYAGNGGMVEVTPTVNRSTRTAWITLSGWSPDRSYEGNITIHLAGLGLPKGRYHILNVVTGKQIPCQSTGADLRTHLRISSGDLYLWKILPTR